MTTTTKITTSATTLTDGVTAVRIPTRRRSTRLGGPALLLAGALLTIAAPPAQARCYTPTEQTAGWKRAPIPDAAPGLAATDSGASADSPIDQFRADEPAVVWHASEQGSLALTASALGRTAYMFRVDGAQWQLLRFQLAGELAGEKVDVIAYTPGGPVPIWLERRLSGSAVAVEWALPGVSAVAVTFHHHLRERPVVTSWQAGVRTTVSAAAWLPAGFRQPRSLYYYHPGGHTVILCDEPGHEMRVRKAALGGAAPTEVRLLPR